MYLRRPVILTDIHPESWNAGNIGTLRIALEAEHLCIKSARLFQFLGFGSDADTVVMKFNDFDRHKTNRSNYSSIGISRRAGSVVCLLTREARWRMFCAKLS